MTLLDINGDILKSEWRTLEAWDGSDQADQTVVPFADLKVHASISDIPRLARLGVRVNVDDDVSEISEYIVHLGLIELVFPHFKDGRPFSTAVMLRRNLGFVGDLRASGDFIPDQGLFLIRCGFTSLILQPQFDVQQARDSLAAYTAAYQSAQDQKVAIVQDQRATASGTALR